MTKDYYNLQYLKDNYFCYREWIYKPYIKSLIAKSNLKKGSTLLDVACGQGFFSYLFNQSGLRVYGVDISEEGIHAARSAYGSIGKLEFAVGDALHLPFLNKFDCVFTRSCTLYNTADFSINQQVTDKLLSYVKDGGTFIFCYNTNFSKSIKNESWRYHGLIDVKKHFAGYSNSKMYFISKIDTLLIREYAFNPLFTKMNIYLSKWFALGGDLVCIYQKNNEE